MKFLQREVKEDSKGQYVHYGGFRLRPKNPRTTKFSLDDTVFLTPTKEYYMSNGARVFQNPDYYEIWCARRK